MDLKHYEINHLLNTDVSIYVDILQFILKSVCNYILYQLFKDIRIKQVRVFTKPYLTIDRLQKKNRKSIMLHN